MALLGLFLVMAGCAVYPAYGPSVSYGYGNPYYGNNYGCQPYGYRPMPITATGPTEILGGTAASTGGMAGVGILGGAAAMAGTVVGIMDGEGGMATTDVNDESSH